jgi:hypothetical protein
MSEHSPELRAPQLPAPEPLVPQPAFGQVRGTEPLLSVIIISPDSYATVRRTVSFLKRQTIRDRLELVFVAPDPDAFQLDTGDAGCFASCQVVKYAPFLASSEARAVGTHAARSALVVLAEDHCYPEPEWAEALVRAHDQEWAGVGPAIRNANPATQTSQANMVIEYGPWLDPVEGGQHSHIPGHNSCYKRDVLLQFGASLGQRLAAESVMQWELQAQGHRFAIEPRAKVRHECFAQVGPSIGLRFHGGRLFAARRAREWSLGRRALFVAASPLIPVVRWLRCLPAATRVNGGTRPWRMWPALAFLLACDGVGEFVGYLTGAGDAARRTSELEFHRYRYRETPAGGANRPGRMS